MEVKEGVVSAYECQCGWQGERKDLHWFDTGRCMSEGQCPLCHHVLEVLDSSD